MNMNIDRKEYDELIAGIFDRHPSVQTAGFVPGAYKPGLGNMRDFDTALGYPSRGFASVHVAGTNGKGSVSSMIAAGLAAAGLRTGLYTSPHLVDFRERIKIVGPEGAELIPREAVWDFLTGNRLDGLSFFEITTGLAFSWFAESKVDVAVIETGLGGRLDSTNVITPELCVITSIGLDHCALLGDTREAIAAEKAGIFKPGVPAIVARRDPQTLRVFEQTASHIGCPLSFAEDFGEKLFETDLKGPYQEENLRTALAALDALRKAGIFRKCAEPSPEAVRGAISRTAALTGFRGRWERLMDKPELICDIGHNPDALAINFRRLEQTGRPLFIVYGIMADKDLRSIRALMPRAARYFLVAPDTERALPVDRLAAQMEGLDHVVCGRVSEGVKAAVAAAGDVPDSLVYVGGSNFVVADCISYLG